LLKLYQLLIIIGVTTPSNPHNMSEFKERILTLILQISLIIGIVYLSANGMDGWGWLLFILFLTI
jgi:hypothetical protein